MKLNSSTLKEELMWQNASIKLPQFDREKMIEVTNANPTWIHFGAGNIFRGFVAKLQQTLLERGLAKEGIIAVDTFDYDIIDKIYRPYDNLTLLVGLKSDGNMEKEVIGSVSESLKGDVTDEVEYGRLKVVFKAHSLQMVSFTITEKGYSLRNMNGQLLDIVKNDMEVGPGKARHAMSMMTALLYERYQNGQLPIAMVSMDNCSHNGDKLKQAIVEIAKAWAEKTYVEADFVRYLLDESKVSFPWSMIDKITPRPAKEVQQMLEEAGVEQMEAIITSKNTFIAPYVNAEIPQYLVIEDKFPNSRPALEEAGVYMTDRETVNNTERMKVTTCLNPLHTALAVYGCLLDYHLIADEMMDPQLKGLVEKIGYIEGIPVVVNPRILDPINFINEVINVRLTNPFIPDMPQRIATDTSQKIAIRFGETIKSYAASDSLKVESLVYIPLVLAGWCRYLLGVNDQGQPMEVSSDPMLAELQGQLQGITLGQVDSLQDQLQPILSNEVLFGIDLYKAGLGNKIEGILKELIKGPGAVRDTLVKYVG